MSRTENNDHLNMSDKGKQSEEDKIHYLKTCLQENRIVADLKWSLFVAALYSYKRDTVLRPFPPMFAGKQSDIDADKRDFKSLENTVDKVPSFDNLLRHNFRVPSNSELTSDLLYWCLKKPSYLLKLCDKNKFSEIKEITKQQTPTLSPHYIFEVVHNTENSNRFDQIRGDQGVLYGYHGSQVENFHSILNFGLQSHMSKNALFGEGTYLSSELAVSLQYSPHGRGWEHSILGDRLSCVAVCEMIDNPAWVKCQTKENTKVMKRIGSRSKIAGSVGGEIPETYYVVRNNEAIRVKYLLLYVDRTRKRSQSWFHRHKFILFICLYGLLLLGIAVYNSHSFWMFFRRHIAR